MRHQITLDISMMAYDIDDARHLGEMIRERVGSLIGCSQAAVRLTNVAPVDCDGPSLFNDPKFAVVTGEVIP